MTIIKILIALSIWQVIGVFRRTIVTVILKNNPKLALKIANYLRKHN
jgi:hypothetical protein